MTQTAEALSDTVHGDWLGGFAGVGTIDSRGLSCSIAAPAAIGGSGEGENPLSLLVAGASGCFLLTLAGLLDQQGLHVLKISIVTEGAYRGTTPPELYSVVHRPTVVTHRSEIARLGVVRKCFQTAKDTCVASRALPGVRVAVEGVIYVEFSEVDPDTAS